MTIVLHLLSSKNSDASNINTPCIIYCLRKYFLNHKNYRFMEFPSLGIDPHNTKVVNDFRFYSLSLNRRLKSTAQV